MVSLLRESGVKWLVPCPNTPYVKRALADFAAGRRERASDAAIASSGGLKCPHAMVVAERRSGSKEDDWRKEPHEKHVAFATNDPGIDVDKYSRRWGTGTNYLMLESMPEVENVLVLCVMGDPAGLARARPAETAGWLPRARFGSPDSSG